MNWRALALGALAALLLAAVLAAAFLAYRSPGLVLELARGLSFC